ncbi:iron transporter [Corynebacterium phocae]|uniref:Iron transporter n=1 Tax=Corynebacterium phocae TaxID=161895 RepID=A0A1L7D0L6_9CORY|nr:Nramp family divalent metal transporter [Corynebacterium phocae]APT91637.1 iron transporter [Corynebacterium phocae]KAA8720715.1 divalent metal cation transporter [Corynebacterium phocae]
MGGQTPTRPAAAPPKKKWSIIGPGLVAAATGVGAGDLVATLIAGQKYGYALLWACIAGAFMKIVLVEGVGRYTIATGHTMFHGWKKLGRWTSWYFVPYIIIWGFVYGAAGMSASAMPLRALFPGTSLEMWAVITALLGFGFTWLGKYQTFEKIIAVLVGIMFITVCGIATLSLTNLPEIAAGLVPRVPDGSFVYVLSLAGGVGGTITLAAYGYWIVEKNWEGAGWMRVMRIDNTVAYVVTGIFVVAMLLIGADLLYSANISVASGGSGLIELADVLADRYGPITSKVFLLGFWAAAFSSVLGVWNGVSLMFADYVGHVKQLPKDHPDIHVGGRYYRWYLIWLTFPPMLLLFLGKPTALVIAYGVLGALFMPFLGLTLLILLNSHHTPKQWRNGWMVNTFMGIISATFVFICANQLWEVLTG